MANTSSYTLWVGDLSRQDIGRVGVKAANLGELMRLGLSVPNGFVVTTEAFDEFLAANALDAGSPAQRVAAAPLPKDLLEALLAASGKLGDVPLAVRSSGVAEDLAGASFAGQYETVLDVRGNGALGAAVRRCWASAFSDRVKQYSAAHGQDGMPRMALLVQPMVKADAAGVAFSANPVTGDRDEVVVSAVRGLGERLVSGQATPDEWVVKGAGAVCKGAPEKAIDAGQVLAIAELARRAEAHFGQPQDVEWAIAGGQLFLLQARPITALHQQPKLEPPPKGFWIKDDSHYPSPITPFGASTYLPALENGGRVMCQEFGLLLEGLLNRCLGGEVYMSPVPLGGKAGPPPPKWVLYLLVRLIPEMRRRRKVADDLLRSNKMERLLDQWRDEGREQFRQEAKDLLGRKLSELDDVALLRHLDDAIALMRQGQVVHFRLFAPYLFALYQLTEICREIGWDDARTLALVSGTSQASSEPALRLAELAASAAKSPVAQTTILEGAAGWLQRLRSEAPGIGAAFDRYVAEYGHRAISYDPGSPTLAERPAVLAKLFRDRMAAGSWQGMDKASQAGKEAISGARAELAKRSAASLERFEQALAHAQKAYGVREDNIFHTDNVPCAVVRYAVMEIGRRLASRGVLASAEDVVYLEDSEVRAALGGQRDDFAGLAVRRKAELKWVSAHPGPPTYGKDPGPPPDPAILPPSLRTVNGVVMWAMALSFTPPVAASADGAISGASGSPGRYTGTARIVRDESQFSRLMPGDVLVCPITTPTWSVLFSQAGAIVTDGGGILSHAAIIAREHGIPAVLGTGDATRRLRDGQTVTVDGSKGLVTPGPE